jgi:malonyl-CoA/methylmalonyl-CoA synthetase
MPTNALRAAMRGKFAGFLAGGRNHRVAAKVEKFVEALAPYLATSRAGAIYLLFDLPRVTR